MVRGVPKMSAKHNPFAAAMSVNRVDFTIGDEDANVINVAMQLKNANGKAIKHRGHIEAYLTSSLVTLAPVATPPAVAIGTDGVAFRGGNLGAVTALTDNTGGAAANNTLEVIPAAASEFTVADTDIDDTPDHVNLETAIAAGVDAAIDAVAGPIANDLKDLAAKVNELIGLNTLTKLQSNATGEIDLNITKTGAATYYLVVHLPGGGVVVSSAITFA